MEEEEKEGGRRNIGHVIDLFSFSEHCATFS